MTGAHRKPVKAAKAAKRASVIMRKAARELGVAKTKMDKKSFEEVSRKFKDAARYYSKAGQDHHAGHCSAQACLASYYSRKLGKRSKDARVSLENASSFLREHCDVCGRIRDEIDKLSRLEVAPPEAAAEPSKVRPSVPHPSEPSDLAKAMENFNASEKFDICKLNSLDNWDKMTEEAEFVTEPTKRKKIFKWARELVDQVDKSTRSQGIQEIIKDQTRAWTSQSDGISEEEKRRRLRGLFADSQTPGGPRRPSLIRRLASIEHVVADAEVKRLNSYMAIIVLGLFAPLFILLPFAYSAEVCTPGRMSAILPILVLAFIGLAFAVPRFSDSLVPERARTLWSEFSVRLMVLIFLLGFMAFIWFILGLVITVINDLCRIDFTMSLLLGMASVIGLAVSRSMARWQTYSTTASQRVVFVITVLLLGSALLQSMKDWYASAPFGGIALEPIGIVGATTAVVIGLGLYARNWYCGRIGRTAQAILDDLAESKAPSIERDGAVPLNHLNRMKGGIIGVQSRLTRIFGKPEYDIRIGASHLRRSSEPGFALLKDAHIGVLRVETKTTDDAKSLLLRIYVPPRKASPTEVSIWEDSTVSTVKEWIETLTEYGRKGKRLQPPPLKSFRYLETYRAFLEAILVDDDARKSYLEDRVRWRGKPRGTELFARLLEDGFWSTRERSDAEYLEAELGHLEKNDSEYTPTNGRWRFLSEGAAVTVAKKVDTANGSIIYQVGIGLLPRETLCDAIVDVITSFNSGQ